MFSRTMFQRVARCCVAPLLSQSPARTLASPGLRSSDELVALRHTIVVMLFALLAARVLGSWLPQAAYTTRPRIWKWVELSITTVIFVASRSWACSPPDTPNYALPSILQTSGYRSAVNLARASSVVLVGFPLLLISYTWIAREAGRRGGIRWRCRVVAFAEYRRPHVARHHRCLLSWWRR